MNRRVLIVDDEPNLILVIQGMLELAGFEVRSARSGTEAIDIWRRESFDTVLTDLLMPGGDGTEVLNFGKESHPDVPVIMMTAFGTIERAVSALKSGAYDFITKPFDQTEVTEAVKKAVETHQRKVSQKGQAIEGGDFKGAIRKHTQTLERELIERALDQTFGNITKAAELLGLSRKGLQLKLKELGLKRGID